METLALKNMLKKLFNADDAWVEGWLTNGDPRTNIAQAMECAEKLGYYMILRREWDGTYVCALYNKRGKTTGRFAGDIPSLAIAKAIAKAIGGE